MIRVSNKNIYNNYILYSNNKFCLANNNKNISEYYDKMFETNNEFYIVVNCTKNIYKYNLMYRDGSLLFDDNNWLNHIKYHYNDNSFSFYSIDNYKYKKNNIKFPIINKNKELFFKIFSILWKNNNIYNKYEKNILNLQELINMINKKLNDISENPKNLNILENSINFFYKLGCPDYLKNNILLFSNEDINKFISIINKNNIFNDIMKRVSYYSLRKELFNLYNGNIEEKIDIIYNNNIIYFNHFFNQYFNNNILYNIEYLLELPDHLSESINNSLLNRRNLFKSIYSIANYINDNNTIKFIFKEDIYNNIDKNILINLMYNEKNLLLKKNICKFLI